MEENDINLPRSNIPPIKKKKIEINPLPLNKNLKLENLKINELIDDNNEKFHRNKRNITVSKTTVEKNKLKFNEDENNDVNDENNDLKNKNNLFDFDEKDDEEQK